MIFFGFTWWSFSIEVVLFLLLVIVSEVEDIVEGRRWFFSFILFSACILSGQYLMDLQIFQSIKANPLIISKYFLCYVACGFVYSSARWVYFLWKFRFERNIQLENSEMTI